MGYLIDGPNKIISLTAGTTTLAASDLYSSWKDWWALGNNMQYDPAFLNGVGGQSISVPMYYILTNGWLIRPQEADHTLSVTGNLSSDGASVFTSTLGDYQVIIEKDSTAPSVALQNIEKLVGNDVSVSGTTLSVKENDGVTNFRQYNTSGGGRTQL